MNNRRRFIVVFGAGGLAAPFSSFAQQQGKVWRVGFLSSRHVDFLDTDNYYGPFRQGITTPEIRTMFLDNARTWTLALAAPPQPPITCDILHQIKIPVLITVGRDTRSYFHIAAEGAAGCIPGVQFVTIPGRHLAIAQKPEAFNAALLQLLATAGSQPKP